MSNQYTIHTGTYTKKDGQSRTMKFIRGRDIPSSIIGSTTNRQKSLPEGSEVVYDVSKRGFRVFNWNTVVGQVNESISDFSFDTMS
jgi:type IV secretory pathway VirB9-like protein